MIQELISMTLIAVMNLKKLIDKLSGNCSFNKSVGSLILRNVNAMLKEVWYLSNLLERSILWKTQDRNSNKAYGSRDLDDKNDSEVISATPPSLCQQVEPKVFTITLTTEGYKDQWQNLSKWCFDENRRLHDCFR